MRIPKNRISYLYRALVFWCSLGLTAPVHPAQEKVLEEHFIFSAKPLGKQQTTPILVSIAKGTVSVIADLQENGAIKSVTKQLKSILAYSKEGEAAISLASKNPSRHATQKIQSHIQILSEVQFSEDGTCRLLFQTDNPAPFGKGNTPTQILMNGEIHVIGDIFAHDRLRVETHISRHEITTEVSVLHQEGVDLQKLKDTKKSPIENDKEFREKCLSALGYQLLEAHGDLKTYPDSILAFNLALYVHGTVKMNLNTEKDYINVAGSCPLYKGCKQKGPSYTHICSSSTFLCFGHHHCTKHSKISVGFRPLLFSYIPEPKEDHIELKHIYLKSPFSVIATICSNPLLPAEHEQKKVFVNIDEIADLDNASTFLIDSGFNSLIKNSEKDTPPNTHDHLKKENPAKSNSMPKLITDASRLSISPSQQIPTDTTTNSRPPSHRQLSHHRLASDTSTASTKTTREKPKPKPVQRVSPIIVPQESWRPIELQKDLPNRTGSQQSIPKSPKRKSYQLFPDSNHPLESSILQPFYNQTPTTLPISKDTRKEPVIKSEVNPRELWHNWYLTYHGGQKFKTLN